MDELSVVEDVKGCLCEELHPAGRDLGDQKAQTFLSRLGIPSDEMVLRTPDDVSTVIIDLRRD
jgi:hypothetical protein